MMKAIVTAIISAFKAIGSFARRVAAAPFQALAHAFGGDVPAVPPVAAPATEDDEDVAPRHDMAGVYRELAIAARTWAANSILACQPEPLPPRFPRAMQEWLRGITPDEAHAIINASEKQVFAHLRSSELIDGLRSVRPLEPAVWPGEFGPLDQDSLDLTCDAGYALAR